MGCVGHDVRLVLEGNSRRGLMRDDGNVAGFPGGAAIERAADKQTAATSIVGPIVECAQFVEGHVADKHAALVVKGHGNVSGDAIVGRFHALRHAPAPARIVRPGGVGVVLEDRHHLLRIVRIHGNSRFSEISRRRSQAEDFRARRFGQISILGIHAEPWSAGKR